MAAAAPRLDDPSDPARGAGASRAYAGYVLGVLVLMNLLNSAGARRW